MAAEKLSGPVVVEDANGDNVKLDDCEVALLTKGPKFSIFKRCTREGFIEAMEIAFIKHRWERKKLLEEMELEDDDDNDDNDDNGMEETAKMIEAESRMVYTARDNTFDWAKQRATDWKENKRVILPKPLTILEESKLALMKEQWDKLFEKYVVVVFVHTSNLYL